LGYKRTYTHIILEYLNMYPGSSVKDISDSTGLSPLIVRKILYKLKNDNYVEKSGNGYVLTERGSRLLEYISSKIPEHRETTDKAQQTIIRLEEPKEEDVKNREEHSNEASLKLVSDEIQRRLGT